MLTFRICISDRIVFKRRSEPFICDVQLLAGTVFVSETRTSKHMKCVCLMCFNNIIPTFIQEC